MRLNDELVLHGLPEIGDVGVHFPVELRITDSSNLTSILRTSVDVTFEVESPGKVVVRDVPDDNGYQLEISWDLSPVDQYLSRYNIYRSRMFYWHDNPPSIDSFTSASALNLAEQQGTVFVSSVNPGTGSYVDTKILQNDVYYYYWVASEKDGVESAKIAARRIGAESLVYASPVRFRVEAPSPNPFNASATIRYILPESGAVSLVIYDVLGRKVTAPVEGFVSAGTHEAVWNGVDSDGRSLSSGLYLYRLKAGEHEAKGKMLLLR
jgi:hypothetical protein